MSSDDRTPPADEANEANELNEANDERATAAEPAAGHELAPEEPTDVLLPTPEPYPQPYSEPERPPEPEPEAGSEPIFPTTPTPVEPTAWDVPPTGEATPSTPPVRDEPVVITPPVAPVLRSRGPRPGTVVWGLVIMAVGIVLIAIASGARIDLQLTFIVLLTGAGLALLIGALLAGRRRGASRDDASGPRVTVTRD
ncbi:hypothetical protein Bcav_3036 [Beutenbergia cavernae DSM 12333]|uniref:Uncharacterized protein n=1 Tax=Beutenbergia cavernae (strain ATCC BAA-8 / DSM 12333 / CCUG 43141 / JCM 11478 / NBRC 16432 / NCIMB 13614 / HKI 0122) TaxID=471853 RepID=C5BZV0_BEUC1|nr:hypothetical protein [Beutenbergia cavernae]ACQ81280.1 hypothetical protein Bcav_3036 [Beutenbergia cavernae DSM 12333]